MQPTQSTCITKSTKWQTPTSTLEANGIGEGGKMFNFLFSLRFRFVCVDSAVPLVGDECAVCVCTTVQNMDFPLVNSAIATRGYIIRWDYHIDALIKDQNIRDATERAKYTNETK